MLKLTALIARRPDLTLERFSQHWRTVHRALALRLVPTGIMRGYVQNHRRPEAISGLEAPADGSPELWVPSVEHVRRLGTCPEYLEGAWLDEPNFMNGRAASVIGTETTDVDEPARPQVSSCVKMMLFARRIPGLTVEQFRQAVAERYRGSWVGVRARRHSYELAVELPADMGGCPYDLVASSWWPDIGTCAAGWERFDRKRAADFIDLTSLAGMLVREEPVFWPEAQPCAAGAAPGGEPVNSAALPSGSSRAPA
jgi:EthD domain